MGDVRLPAFYASFKFLLQGVYLGWAEFGRFIQQPEQNWWRKLDMIFEEIEHDFSD